MKYKVLKEFIDTIGAGWLEGDEFDDDNEFLRPQIKGLLFRGFIEEVKENTRWRAERESTYFSVDEYGEVGEYNDLYRDLYDSQYDYGNYFKSQETAEKVAEALELLFDYLHDTDESNPYDILSINAKLEFAINKARQAVLADDKELGTYDYDGIAGEVLSYV